MPCGILRRLGMSQELVVEQQGAACADRSAELRNSTIEVGQADFPAPPEVQGAPLEVEDASAASTAEGLAQGPDQLSVPGLRARLRLLLLAGVGGVCASNATPLMHWATDELVVIADLVASTLMTTSAADVKSSCGVTTVKTALGHLLADSVSSPVTCWTRQRQGHSASEPRLERALCTPMRCTKEGSSQGRGCSGCRRSMMELQQPRWSRVRLMLLPTHTPQQFTFTSTSSYLNLKRRLQGRL